MYYDTSIVEVALKFSFDNNIVESKEWANQKPENGLDGGDTNSGKKRTQETKDKTSASMQGKNIGPRSQETKDKISAAKKGKNTGLQSEEHKAKRSASMRKPKSKCICPHCVN